MYTPRSTAIQFSIVPTKIHLNKPHRRQDVFRMEQGNDKKSVGWFGGLKVWVTFT